MLITCLSTLVAVFGLVFAGFLISKIVKQKIEDKSAEVISSYIHNGAMTFLFKEYFLLSIFVIILTLIIITVPVLSWKIAITFFIGSVFSMIAGFVSIKVSTISNIRTAEECRKDLRSGFNVAFSSGSIIGLIIVSLGLLGISLLYLVFNDPEIIYGFGFGASLVALFSRVGGGIYTKAADVGADLVGKIESSIPEDDPRNPASIADNVGDNVGDVAGMGADLFESYVDSIITAMFLGVLFLPLFGSKAVVLPLLISAIGIIATILSNVIVKYIKAKPRLIINSASWIAGVIIIFLSFFAIKFTVGDFNIFLAMLVGLVSGIIIGLSTEYYTSNHYRPVQKIALASQSGSATNIISGFSVGFFSTLIPVISISLAIYLSYYFADIYGVAISAVGMLSTLGMILAANAYAPVVDNAAGIAQMAGLGLDVRERAEELDSIGNTSAAIGKGFAISNAALAALVLLISYGMAVNLEVINLIDPRVIVGLFIGGLLPFIFSALTINAVGKSASSIIKEVRRQFKEIDGLMSGQAEPNYGRCIEISTMSALKQMIAPSILAIASPVVVGFLLGVSSLAGMLAGSILTGLLLAIFMSNSGGAWDNAKKFIEAGNFGGKGTDAHESSIVGDTVGDPLKDTAGPALNILIKLMAIISIIIVPLLLI